MVRDDYREVIAAACEAVRQQAPANLPPGSCPNIAVAAAFLLHRAGFTARVTGGAASWRVGPNPKDIIAFDPAIDPDSFHCWTAIDMPAGSIFADASTFALPGLPPHIIWTEPQHHAWRYAESRIALPQVIAAQERLLSALQSPPL